MTIKIVTDSGCDVPPDLAQKLDITVIPLYVNIGEQGYREGVDISRAEFYANLTSYDPYPTTAAPPIDTFTNVYEKLAAEGADEIISLHISGSVSNTLNVAGLGAQDVESATVIAYDTQQITLGAGLLALKAAEMAQAGYSLDEIIAALDERVPRTRVFGMINTLDSLRRGGRVSWAEFGIGSLLQIKPVMEIKAGEIIVHAKVRTRKRAIKKMQMMVAEYQPFERIAVIHVNAPEAAADLREQSKNLFPEGETPIIQDVSPAIGTHLGPGAVGFAAISRS
ncbi:MAG TPA: DegV family protein [Anaerolineae bacterium]|nr:DegV family protein [Anaerolineae bacterium]HIP71428.1 DegV family protein [Anaerolineae bacterium]